MAAKKPLVSVVVISRNRASLLRGCLESIFRQDFPSFEVVVVDDASTDSTPETAKAFPVKYVRNSSPLGVSGARNRGIADAEGDIIAFVDDDCVVPKGWLGCIVKCFDESAADAVGGKALNPDGSVQFEGATVDAWGKNVYGRPAASGLFVSFHGCNMAFRKSALMDAGGFDQAYRYGLDETDLCVRLALAGRRLVQCNSAVLTHLDEASGGVKRLKPFFNARSRRYFMLKNFGEKLSFAGLAFFEAGTALSAMKNFFLRLLGVRARLVPFGTVRAVAGALEGYKLGFSLPGSRHKRLKLF